jgi:hypothetical protein
MPSKIQVDQIAGATGSTVTLPSGQTLDLSSGTVNLPSASLSALNATNLTSGTVPSARLSLTSSDLPTVPTTKGGTGLTTIGTAGQVLKVNSGATALEYGTAPSGKLLAVYYNQWVDQYSVTGMTPVTIYTGANLTLASTASKVLILVDLSLGGASYGGSVGMQFSTNNGSSYSDITTLNMADVDGGLDSKSMIGLHLNMGTGGGNDFMMQDSFSYLHSPNSSQVKYRLVMAASDSSYSIYNNRRGSGGWGGMSHLTQMEIGA